MKLRLRWSLATLMLMVAVAAIVIWLKAPEWSVAYRVWLANRAIHDVLARPLPLGQPDEVPFDVVLAEIRAKTKGSAFPKGLPIYIDPIALQVNDIHMAMPVKINTQAAPLGRSLEHVFGQLRLVYEIENGLVKVTSRDLAGK